MLRETPQPVGQLGKVACAESVDAATLEHPRERSVRKDLATQGVYADDERTTALFHSHERPRRETGAPRSHELGELPDRRRFEQASDRELRAEHGLHLGDDARSEERVPA